MKQKTAYLLIGVAIILTALGAYFLGKGDIPLISTKTQTVQTVTGWQTYDAATLGYSFQYPADWDTYDLSGTLAVGPESAIEDLRELDSRALGYDSPYLVMQVHVVMLAELEGSYVSDEYQEVVSEKVLLAGTPATKHTITNIQSSPGGDVGTQTMAYVVPVGQRAIIISLLDLRYKPLLEQIVSTFSFTKTSTDSLVGKTISEVRQQKGEPTDTDSNATTKKEIWVYAGTGDDATATYVYIENGKVSRVVTDEYSGTLEGNSWVK